jgi:ATP adenylyltransferase
MTNHYLWTPWRMQYITGAQDRREGDPKEARPSAVAEETDLPQVESTGCVFCDRARAAPEHDRANLVLLRGERNFVILNLYPYNSAHMMVVPYLHTADFASLDAKTAGEMTGLLQKMLRVISEEYKPEGYNMGMNLGRVAGAGVADHVHMHLVPRWAGDTNFMPIVGATKVMPELLETTYDRLKRRL